QFLEKILSAFQIVKEQVFLGPRPKKKPKVLILKAYACRMSSFGFLSPKGEEVVELCGIEPQTSCVQGRRSPS
ncbi:hypothetical protein, partial [uncultured Ferrimonas sp.]|uniref:hypothetical protein n=1 Tax=uncultured Ferrimonas sp. TaxID=432640 RepID=UPI00262C107B